MSGQNHRIDVHYHIIPQPYVRALKARGIEGAPWVPFPRWTPEMALKHLDRTNVSAAITSLSTPGVWFGDASLARSLSRLCNEFQAEMMAAHPRRFGSLAFLPLPDVEGALTELEYALDRLGHDGVVLLSDVDGRYLGDPAYEELFQELDRREAVVFVHPHTDPREPRESQFLDPLLEWPVHTTRAVMDLLYSGRLARFPRIRYFLAHGGGTVPYLAHRMAAASGNGAATTPGDQGLESEDPGSPERLRLLQNLYFDTAAPGVAHLTALKELAGTSRILFGTDGGWTPPIQTGLAIKTLLAFRGFSEAEVTAIERENASILFPRFAAESRTEGPVAAAGRTASERSAETGPGVSECTGGTQDEK